MHIVFGEYEGTYCASLGRTYATYSSSIVISMLSNYFFVDVLKHPHTIAWFITMIWTGIYNYIMLKATWKGKKVKTNSTLDSPADVANSSHTISPERQKGDVEEHLQLLANTMRFDEQKGWTD